MEHFDLNSLNKKNTAIRQEINNFPYKLCFLVGLDLIFAMYGLHRKINDHINYLNQAWAETTDPNTKNIIYNENSYFYSEKLKLEDMMVSRGFELPEYKSFAPMGQEHE